MITNDRVNISLNVNNLRNVTESSIATVVINQDKSVEDLLADSHREIIDGINDGGKISTNEKRSLLVLADRIYGYFKDNIHCLEKILFQINCKMDKSSEDNKLSIVKLMSFLVIGLYCDSNAQLPDDVKDEITIRKKKNWLFNAVPGVSTQSLEKHLSRIAEYIARTPESNIENGNCFLTMLHHNKQLNCNDCEKGLLKDAKINNILDDYFNSEVKEDFFHLRRDRNILFFCGNCISNISECEYAKEILEDI